MTDGAARMGGRVMGDLDVGVAHPDAHASADLLTRFEEWQSIRNLSKRTITDRGYRLRELKGSLPSGDLLDADADAITAWLDKRPLRPLTPPSRAQYITAIRSFYQWAIDEGYLFEDPTRRVVKPRLPLRRPRPLTLEQVQALLTEPPTTHPAVHVWVAEGAYAGMRVAEMADLQVSEVDLSRGKVDIRGGKGDRDRTVDLHDVLRRELLRLPMPKRGLVTPKLEGLGGYVPTTVGGYISRHMRIARVEGTPHQLRHFFITEVADKADIVAAKEAAGHASITTTAGYTAPNSRRLREAVLAVGSREGDGSWASNGGCCQHCRCHEHGGGPVGPVS